MQTTVIGKRSGGVHLKKMGWLLMLFFPFTSFSQRISLYVTDAPLSQVLTQIEQTTDYHFIYVAEELNEAKPVTLSVKKRPLEAVLEALFAQEPFTYTINKNYISLHLKEPATAPSTTSFPFHGKVINDRGEGVGGTSILVKGSELATASDENGDFSLDLPNLHVTLVVTSIGYQRQEVPLKGASHLLIHLQTLVSSLDETVIIAYGKTTRRLNTGSVGKVNAEQISEQPVSNPLATLAGRIPGLFVTQQNGLPGADFSVLIRGRNSIQQGTNPLYIIDGTPFISDDLTQRSGGLGNNNPFNSINPNDIESIEVLKDADATAIYGSRGANGVILITTKRGTSNQTHLEVSYKTGWGKITRMMPYLNTSQYVAMRKEAFKNDQELPTIDNAPDLLLWDTTRYTKWEKLLIGGTARMQSLQTGLSGGNGNTKFYLGANYNKETTVYPGNLADQRGSANLSINHHSLDSKLTTTISVSYSEDKNNLLPFDLTQYINTAPDAPAPYDGAGHLNWSEGGASFNNPFGVLRQTYDGTTDRLTASSLLSYQLSRSFALKANAGYNFIQLEEHLTFPMSSFNPATFPTGAASFATNSSRIYNLEPQLEFNHLLGTAGKVNALVGATWQQTQNHLSTIDGYNYTNDDLLNSTAGAPNLYTNYTSNLYRYNGIFSRIGYNLDNKYLLNVTGRRDGSSRFGLHHQLANFYAVGLGWIFSQEKLLQKFLPFISFGKLRGSYGTSGNDQIGNYQYLDTWSATYFTYQGQPGLRPTRLSNPNYSWELNRKLDLALELGLAKDRVFLSADWYRNQTDNQIIYATVPAQTGFTSLLMNFPAVVENAGWELEARATLLRHKNAVWTLSANITIPTNKLVSFPGLEQSSYASSYEIGKPLDIYRGYQYLGVDPTTGVYVFSDLNKDGVINAEDYVTIGSTNPSYYGGITNSLKIKNMQLDVFFQVIHQLGRQPIFSLFYTPGQELVNFPVSVLNRWQKPGDQAAYQQFSQSPVSNATAASWLVNNSSAILTKASFIRLKNLSLSYLLTSPLLRKAHIQSGKIFVEAQNLLTLTSYQGADPENQNPTALPPLKMIAVGFQITL